MLLPFLFLLLSLCSIIAGDSITIWVHDVAVHVEIHEIFGDHGKETRVTRGSFGLQREILEKLLGYRSVLRRSC